MRVVFVRHGQAESNLWGMDGIVGQPSDLTEEGRQQARRTARFLKNCARAQEVYSSPFPRARQTAALLAEALGLEVVIDDRLREIDKGEWVGRPVREVVELESAVAVQDRPGFRPPGGENWADVGARVAAFIAEKRAASIPETLIVTHDHPIRMGLGALLGTPLESWEERVIPNASLTVLEEAAGSWRLDPARVGCLPPTA